MESTMKRPIEILRRPEVLRITGLSDSGLDRAAGFPQAVRLMPRTVGWVKSEVEDWLMARANARPTKGWLKDPWGESRGEPWLKR